VDLLISLILKSESLNSQVFKDIPPFLRPIPIANQAISDQEQLYSYIQGFPSKFDKSKSSVLPLFKNDLIEMKIGKRSYDIIEYMLLQDDPIDWIKRYFSILGLTHLEMNIYQAIRLLILVRNS